MSRLAACCSMLLVAFLASPVFAKDPVPRFIYDARIGREPELNAISEASPGESVYLEFSYWEVLAARLLTEAVVTRDATPWPVGKMLHAADLGGLRVFCDPTAPRMDLQVETGSLTPPEAPALGNRSYLCLYDEDDNGFFEGIRSSGYPPPEHFARVGYELDRVRMERLARRAKTFRKQLFYRGRSDRVLRLEYSEVVDDLAGPALSRPLTLELDLTADEPLGLLLLGMRIEVIETTDSAFRYRVLRGFQH